MIPVLILLLAGLSCFSRLHIAAEQGFVGTINILLKASADVNARDIEGFTPLHLSVRAGNHEAVHVFLRSGSNIHAVSIRLWTSSHLAAESGHLTILKDLLALDESLLHVREVGAI
jgi:ankyrin repeat protein